MSNLLTRLKALLPDRLHTDLQYFWRFRRLRNHRDPVTFQEMLLRKKLQDSKYLRELGPLADKYEVRRFVREVAGEALLIPLVGVYETVDEIDLASLPDSFVMKGTHGSGMNLFVRNKADVDWLEAKATANGWLARDYSELFRETPYRAVPRRLVIEELILASNGQVPRDYKFYVFSGKARLLEVDYSRFSGHKQAFFLPDGRRLGVNRGRAGPVKLDPLPQRLDVMVEIAERLGHGHDFVRVDLYEVEDRILFSELTFYPAGGMGYWRPHEFELELGQVWREQRPVSEEWVIENGASELYPPLSN